jgi:uncharacterized protein YbbK (DUF523 family)
MRQSGFMVPSSLPATFNQVTDPRPRLVISACLLGDPVRYDGDHKRDSFLVGPLADHVQWLSICPEVELGLGVPREKIQLEVATGGIQLVACQSRRDLTGAMQDWAAGWARSQQEREICGFVLKSGSPSCGIGDVRVKEAEGFSREGTGLFAETVMRSFPGIPVTTEKQIHQPGQLEHFLVRIFARQRLLKLLAEPRADRRQQLLGEEQMLLETHRQGSFEELVAIQEEAELVEKHASLLSRPVVWKEHRRALLAASGQLQGESSRNLERRIAATLGDSRWTRWTTELLEQARHQGSPLASQSYLQPLPAGCLPAEAGC